MTDEQWRAVCMILSEEIRRRVLKQADQQEVYEVWDALDELYPENKKELGDSNE